MTSNKRKPARPEPEGTKILVSGHPISFPTLNGTIEFDKKIPPGIFTPSAPVPGDQAAEYRNVVGTCGVMVYGSLMREMTTAEIHGLIPDHPNAAGQQMRSVDSRGERFFYNVWYSSTATCSPHKLDIRAQTAITKALGKKPSAPFIKAIEDALGRYKQHRTQVSAATPARVLARIRKVRKQTEALLGTIDCLEAADWSLIEQERTAAFLRNQPAVSTSTLRGRLDLYRGQVGKVERRFAALPTGSLKGRMRGYAEDSFAAVVACLYYDETGKRPTSTRSGEVNAVGKRDRPRAAAQDSPYTKVLVLLLNLVPRESSERRAPLKNVEALAQRAVDSQLLADHVAPPTG